MANTPVGQQSPLDSVHKCERMHGRFAGQWERNTQHGFGVFVSAGGRERYVGEWRNGKKHGYGRWVTDDTFSAFFTLLSVRYPVAGSEQWDDFLHGRSDACACAADDARQKNSDGSSTFVPTRGAVILLNTA